MESILFRVQLSGLAVRGDIRPLPNNAPCVLSKEDESQKQEWQQEGLRRVQLPLELFKKRPESSSPLNICRCSMTRRSRKGEATLLTCLCQGLHETVVSVSLSVNGQ